MTDVVLAAEQLRDRRKVLVDAHEQGEDLAPVRRSKRVRHRAQRAGSVTRSSLALFAWEVSMATYEYDDFRIRFTPVAGGHSYDVVADSPDGLMAHSTFELPLTDEDLRRAVMSLGSTRSVIRD